MPDSLGLAVITDGMCQGEIRRGSPKQEFVVLESLVKRRDEEHSYRGISDLRRTGGRGSSPVGPCHRYYNVHLALAGVLEILWRGAVA